MAILTFACSDHKIVHGEVQSVGETWGKGEVVSFDIPELDSLQTYNVFLQLRNTNDYAYNNIFMIVSLDYPNGKQEIDTLEYRMAYPNGEWMGEGIGNIKDNLLWYKENFRFIEKGEYRLSIEQAVRKNGRLEGDAELVGITDIGYRIEHTQNE